MRKKTFSRMRKILGILLFVSLIVFVTAASASAKTVNNDYQTGYQAGNQAGYKVGYDAGNQDCLKHGKNGVLTKVPAPAISKNWTKSYTKGFKKGFKEGYLAGYKSMRFKCLKKDRL
jgi:flagellar biosynthesis/type III secretory pathway protein FliH